MAAPTSLLLSIVFTSASQRAEPARSSLYGHRAWLPILALIVAAAAIRIGHGLLRLTSASDARGGIDLQFRLLETQAWFAGAPVYGTLETADYPPASYILFWPVVGWTDEMTARWIWAGLSIGCLTILAAMIWRALAERPAAERAALALVPLAGYATHGTLVTGQLPFVVLAAVVGGTLMLLRARPALWSDLAGAALIVISLVKPTLAAPIAWIGLLAPRRARPAFLIAGGYALLSLLAASLQDASLVELTRAWLDQRDDVNVGATYGNLQKLLVLAGAPGAFLPLAVAAMLLTGGWVWRHRAADPWLLLGVTALVTRLLTYHRSFDDLLVVLPMVAAARLASRVAGPGGLAAAAMAALLAAGALAPRVLVADLQLALQLLNLALPLTWLGALALLLVAAERGSAADVADVAPVARRAVA